MFQQIPPIASLRRNDRVIVRAHDQMTESLSGLMTIGCDVVIPSVVEGSIRTVSRPLLGAFLIPPALPVVVHGNAGAGLTDFSCRI